MWDVLGKMSSANCLTLVRSIGLSSFKKWHVTDKHNSYLFLKWQPIPNDADRFLDWQPV